MTNLRKYGKAPFDVAVIHGGPGAGGEMAPVARELASGWGILEPIQTATSLDGQVDELKTVLEENADVPVTLIGSSWGAWLSFIVAAKFPALVKKLVLIGSGGFETKYGIQTSENRLKRLGVEERELFKSLLNVLGDPAAEDKDASLRKLGELVAKADSYDPLPSAYYESDLLGGSGDIFQGVWKDADEMRRSGKLLELAHHIRCPVVAIHGDYDPHPAEGVEKPLSAVLKDFRFILLENCGHMPWIEKQAKEKFYDVLRAELQ